jgi:hypothetical protein
MGLIAGLAPFGWEAFALVALIAAVMSVGDAPALLARYRHQTMRLDRAFTDEAELRAHLEEMLGGTVRSLIVQHVDLVDDTTVVDVRYQVGARALPTAPSAVRATADEHVREGALR